MLTLTFTFAAYSQLLLHSVTSIALVEVVEENPALHKCADGKGSILTDFQVIVDILFFDTVLYKHWTGSSFLKISCKVEPETILMNFLYSVTLSFICLSCILNESIILDQHNFVPACSGHLENINSPLTYFIIQYFLKHHTHYITTKLIRKV